MRDANSMPTIENYEKIHSLPWTESHGSQWSYQLVVISLVWSSNRFYWPQVCLSSSSQSYGFLALLQRPTLVFQAT